MSTAEETAKAGTHPGHEEDRVHVEKEEGYAILTLCDPARRNALSLEMAAELLEVLSALEATTSVRAVVVTGAPPAFCAGADLTQLEVADAEGLRSIYAGFAHLATSRLFSVAAVNGAAVGAGMNMALACDVRLAAERASFDTRFLALGLHPGGGHTWMLRRAVSYSTAAALVLGAQTVRGPEAARIGLAFRCVPDDELLVAARQLVVTAAGAPQELVARMKATLRAVQHEAREHAAHATGEDPALEQDQGGEDAAYREALDHELVQQLWSVRQPYFADQVSALRRRISSRP